MRSIYRISVKNLLNPGHFPTFVVGNKELMIIPDAVHAALYDDKNNRIPYDKTENYSARFKVIFFHTSSALPLLQSVAAKRITTYYTN